MKVLVLVGFLLYFEFLHGLDYEATVNEISEVPNSRQKAVKWLFSKQNQNGGWGTKEYPQTHRVLISIILSNENYKDEYSTKYENSVEQLKAELSYVLSEKMASISAGQLALYANALMAIRNDPLDINGINIINKMMEKRKISDYEKGLVALSACLAKGENDVPLSDDLNIDFLENLNSYFIDSRAVIVMALVCAKEKYERNDFEKYIQEQVKSFKARQTPEGNFGNVYTSALLTQALIASGDNGDGWSFDNSINYLLSEQTKDWSFGDLLGTYFVLPVLSGHSFLNIDSINFQNSYIETIKDSDHAVSRSVSRFRSDSRYSSNLQISQYTVPENYISITYSVWIEKDIPSSCFTFYSRKFTVPENSTFVNVMKIAQSEDNRYKFKAKNHSWGNFIEEINEIGNDKNNSYYWMLHKINEDGNLILTSYGVDGEIPKYDDHYIFKYCTGICNVCESEY